MKMCIRRLGAAFGLVFACSVLNRTASADPFLTGAGVNISNNAGYTLGYQIIVGAQPIQLTALGLWDEGSDGLGASHGVGIWGSSTTPLAQVTVPAGTSAALVDGYRFTNLSAPIVLSANTTYTLGAVYNSDDVARNISPFDSPNKNAYASPGITIGFGEYNPGSTLQDPAGADVSTIYTGPNGLFTIVPEPASASLLICAAAMIRRRR